MNQEEHKLSRQKKQNFHLAGIIPVEAQPLGFDMPWSDALMPIAKNYLAVERAVYECAYAGCETIWLICSRETSPILRERLGDWILDPTINVKQLSKTWNPSERLKQIPIFYVPIHPKDKQKRTGIAWSIIYGYNRAYQISKQFSRWATPGKYYVAFPHGVYTPSQLKESRLLISSEKSYYLKDTNGKTAKDGELLGFTFDSKEMVKFKKSFHEKELRLWKSGGVWKDGAWTGEKLPKEQRYTGRFVALDTLLESINITDQNTLPIRWYHNISSWDKYCSFLASQERTFIKRPSSAFKYHDFNPIGLDNDFDEENFELEEVFDIDDEIG